MPPQNQSTEENVFANITAQRRLEGIEFTIRCPGLEHLFRHLSGGTDVVARPAPPTRSPDEVVARVAGRRSQPSAANYTGPTRRYQLETGDNGLIAELIGFTAGRFDMWGSPELILSRGPKLNLSMFTAVGLTEGVTLMVPTVMSDKLLNDFLGGCESALRQIYIDYLADRSHAIEIVTTHIIQD